MSLFICVLFVFLAGSPYICIMEVKMTFRDTPIGAIFKYPGSDSIWVKLDSNPKSQWYDGDGLICLWNGNVSGHQKHCRFSDESLGINFDTEITLI